VRKKGDKLPLPGVNGVGNDRIVLFGTTWCGQSRRTRLFFEQRDIEFDYVNIDQDPEAAQLVQEINHGYRSVPTILFPDGSTLTEPSIWQLEEKLGLGGG
jgi:mycoredoxin